MLYVLYIHVNRGESDAGGEHNWKPKILSLSHEARSTPRATSPTPTTGCSRPFNHENAGADGGMSRSCTENGRSRHCSCRRTAVGLHRFTRRYSIHETPMILVSVYTTISGSWADMVTAAGIACSLGGTTASRISCQLHNHHVLQVATKWFLQRLLSNQD